MRTCGRFSVRGFIGVFESLDISGSVSAETRGGDTIILAFDFVDFE